MNSELVKESLRKYSEVLSFNYPAVGWYFSSEKAEDSFTYKKDKWVCMFMYWKMVLKKGKRICFSADIGNACPGPTEFFGFAELIDDGGEFISETERFKKTKNLAIQYHKDSSTFIHPPKEQCLYMQRIEDIDDKEEIEVVNLFPNLRSLTSLTVMSYYDRNDMVDSVITPFASGCQSTYGIPYFEKFQEKPRSVIGMMDVLVRDFIPEDMISFSAPSNRYIEMANNIKGSFLDKNFNNPKSF